MIHSLFDKQRKETSFFSWLFLGPFFLITSSVLAVIFSEPLFLSCTLFGLVLCMLFDQKGLYASLLYLLGLSAYIHSYQQEFSLMQLGVEISFALGLFVTFISFHDAKSFFLNFTDKIEEKEKLSEELKDQLEEEKRHFLRYKDDTEKEFNLIKHKKDEQADLLACYRRLADLLSKRDKQNHDLKIQFEKEKNKHQKELIGLQLSISTFRKRYEDVKKEKNQFLKKLNDLRHEFYQKKVLFTHRVKEIKNTAYAISQKSEIAQLEKANLREKLEHSQSHVKKLCLRLDELSLQLNQKKEDAKYQELKKQFQDKNKVLHETRDELFHLNEALIAKQMEEEESSLYLSKDLEKAYFLLEKVEERYLHLQEENKRLSSLISKILKKQKVVAVEKQLPFN